MAWREHPAAGAQVALPQDTQVLPSLGSSWIPWLQQGPGLPSSGCRDLDS